MLKKEKKTDQEDGVKFLLTEYSEVFEEYRRVREEGVRRLQFFVTLVTAILGGLVILFQFVGSSWIVFQISSIIFVFILLVLGWDIFRYLLSRDRSSDFNMRAMGRIRRYFVDHNLEISDYLVWDADDEPSFFINPKRHISPIITTMVIFMSVLGAFMVGVLSSFYSRQVGLMLIVGSITFFVLNYSLRFYAKKRILKAFTSAQKSVKFPKKKSDGQ